MAESKHPHLEITDFTHGSIPKQLYRFATPLVLSSLLQVFYNMVDMIIVGHALGKTGLSAVSIGGDIVTFLTWVTMGIANAGQVLISQYVGADRRDRIGRFIGTMFFALLLFALGMSALCLGFRHSILRLLHAPSESYAGALAYSSICAAGLLFIAGYNAVAAVLRGLGDSKHPFLFIGLAAVLNIALDLLFVLGFDMGAGGAALATVISQGLSFLLCGLFLVRRRDLFDLTFSFGEFAHPDREMLGSLLKLGIPMAIKSGSVSVSKLFVSSYVNAFGVAVSAFAGIANKVSSMANLVSNSLNTAGASMVGQNIGAKKFGRVPKIMKTVYLSAGAIALGFALVVLLFPLQFYGIFTSDPDVLAIGLEYIPIALLMFAGTVARSGSNALLNGSGNYRMNFLVAILDGIILRVGLSFLFGAALGLGYLGFWLGDALAGFTPLWITIWFYFSGAWKRRVIAVED